MFSISVQNYYNSMGRLVPQWTGAEENRRCCVYSPHLQLAHVLAVLAQG